MQLFLFFIFISQIAMDYDEISQWKTEGFELQCVSVDKEGVKDNQEEMWGMFLMTYAEKVPQVQITV
jgi:hypothetical protein